MSKNPGLPYTIVTSDNRAIEVDHWFDEPLSVSDLNIAVDADGNKYVHKLAGWVRLEKQSAALNAFDEQRQDIIGQNGNDGLHYEADTAESFLSKAADIMRERGKTHDKSGKRERSMAATVAAFNAITGRELTEPEGWLFMSVLKRVRQYQNPAFHRDSAEDAVSYAALEAEALAKEASE